MLLRDGRVLLGSAAAQGHQGCLGATSQPCPQTHLGPEAAGDKAILFLPFSSVSWLPTGTEQLPAKLSVYLKEFKNHY